MPLSDFLSLFSPQVAERSRKRPKPTPSPKPRHSRFYSVFDPVTGRPKNGFEYCKCMCRMNVTEEDMIEALMHIVERRKLGLPILPPTKKPIIYESSASGADAGGELEEELPLDM